MAPHRQGGAGKGYHVDQGRTVNLSAEPPPAAMAEECDVGCDDDVSSDLNDGAIDGSDDDYEDDCWLITVAVNHVGSDVVVKMMTAVWYSSG